MKMISKIILCKQNTVFFIFIVVSVALRFFSFFPSVLDHDESTYMIIGRDILHGKSLYSDVTDTKPVGIFLFYAGLEFLFGNSIFWKRFAFAILVGVTGFLISRISKKLFRQENVAFAAGFIYIIYTSIWTYHGRSPNTELLFNFFTASSLLLLLKRDTWNYMFAGLFMGIGFMVKYLVLFDFTAFLLFFFILEIKQKENWRNAINWWRYVLSSLFFVIPFALTNLYFWLGNHFEDFYYVSYILPGNYGGNPSIVRYVTMLLDLAAKFLPISFMLFYVVFSKNKISAAQHKCFFILWITAVFVAMYLPGQEYSHYTIQLMLPLSLLAALFFHSEFKTDRVTEKLFSKKYGIPILLVLLLGIQIVSFKNEVVKPDYEQEVADYLAPKMKKNDGLYVSNYHQIVYYLLGIESPTKFVHSSLLYTNNSKGFNINVQNEIQRIINTKPRFVIIKFPNKMVEDLIKHNYRLIKMFNQKRVRIYEKKG